MSKMVDINPHMTKQTMCPGTLAFMPPEALLSKPIYSDKLDVFSCGVLIVQIITRKFPTPKDAHRTVNDPKYGRIQVPISELERRKNDLLGVFLTHPLRQFALNCLSDADGDRPTASTLCQSLMGLIASPEYASSSSSYQQQLLALPPPQSAYGMRDTEIAVLDEQIRSLTQETDWIKSRGFFRKKDTSQLDTDIADLQQRKQPLIAERECQREEERKKEDYRTENSQLKKKVENIEAEKEIAMSEKETAMSENADLKEFNATMERERRAAELEKVELYQKISELKQIVHSCLVHKSEEQDAPRQVHSESDTQLVSKKKLQHSNSLPSLKLACNTGLSDIEENILDSKVLRLHISELYQSLNGATVLQQLVDEKLVKSDCKEAVITYDQKYAQNMVVISALFHCKSVGVLPSLCNVLESTGSTQEQGLATLLRSDRNATTMRNHFPESFAIHSFVALQNQFSQMLQSVMEAFAVDPDSLRRLKQFFCELVLPLGKGKMVAVVDPTRYDTATTTRELFRQHSDLWNCFSPELLKMMCEECQCTPAIEAVQQFMMFRKTHANLLICQQKAMEVEELGGSAMLSSLYPFHLSCHSEPTSDLQSLHSGVFQHLDKDKKEPRKSIRLTVEINRPRLTLQDYDNITNAVCGYFEIPRASLVYGSCSCNGYACVVCWLTSSSLQPYLKNVNPGRSAERLLAEQLVVGVVVGDIMQFLCLGMKEVELFEAAFYGHTKRLRRILQQNVPVNAKNKNGWTALHLAAVEGIVDVVRLLTEAQAQLDIQSEDGKTPLYIASKEGHIAVVKLLLELSADVSISNKRGWTPLMAASFSGHFDIVRTLIKAKAQINTQNQDGWTALHLAAQEGRVDIVRVSTEAGAQLDIQTEDGQTALYIASRKGHTDVVKLLLELCADVSISNTIGWTPLMAASFGGHVDIVRILIEAKAQINTQKQNGWTALHLAAQEGRFDVVRVLTNAKAQLHIKTEKGKKAIDIARSKGHSHIVCLLESKT